jgi:hypothetical protein
MVLPVERFNEAHELLTLFRRYREHLRHNEETVLVASAQRSWKGASKFKSSPLLLTTVLTTSSEAGAGTVSLDSAGGCSEVRGESECPSGISETELAFSSTKRKESEAAEAERRRFFPGLTEGFLTFPADFRDLLESFLPCLTTAESELSLVGEDR